MVQVRPDELIRILLGELEAVGAGLALLGYDENGAFAGDQNITGANSIGMGDTVAVASDYSVIGGGRTNTIVAGADYAVIGGGRDNSISNAAGDYSTIGGGYYNDIAATYGVISGGNENTIVAGATYATIGGGLRNTISNLAADTSVIGGGWYNDVSADNGTVGGGAYNTVSDNEGVVAGGRDNSVAERYGAIGGGRDNEIIANIHSNNYYCAIPGGFEARAELYGQLAHASGKFAMAGDAQGTVQFVTRRVVTHDDAVWYSLLLDGAGANYGIIIPADSVRTFHALVVGTTQGCTKSFGYEIRGVIENDGGATTMLATTTTTLYEDDISFDARAEAVDPPDVLVIQVQDTDGTGDIVRWVATIRTAEVTFPA